LNALVLGIGNILLSDEGVGVKVVEELDRRYQFPPAVEVVDGGTSGMELLSRLDNKEHLILIDAVKSGHPPGTAVRVEGDDVPTTFMERITPHQLGISDLLATARLTDDLPAKMVLFGIEPKALDLGLCLSPEVENSLDTIIDAVIDELRNFGYEVKEQ
jgi:hydrogenase maturation protease